MNFHLLSSLREARVALDALIEDESAHRSIVQAASILVDTFERNGRVFSCGNGGSMCDAMHFAEELTGRYRQDRRALGATAISDAGHLTCVGNDLGYEEVFARYVEAHGRKGDCLVALSTSGSSKNILRAAQVAQSMGVAVVALTGKREAVLAKFTDVHICTPAGMWADRVQELHIKVLHILIELVERRFFPQNYNDVRG